MILKEKNGSGIHIKKSHRGLFTKYCNGKVTDECIRRGKNSSDPKIRKRATFADNAIHFKHKSGGKAFVKSPVLDSNPNIYKYNKKRIKKHALGGITDDLIDSVIKEEGFNSTPTNIGDGKITLGSGLTDSVWHEIYKKKGKWTEEDNRNAVKKELEKRLKWALDTVPNWNKLNDNLQKAFLSYNYNYNVTPKNSPKFFHYMKLGLFDLAGKEMNATSDDPKFKQGLLERRLREQVLWNTPIPQPKIYIKEPKLTEQSDNTKVFNTQYPSTHRIIPTKKGSYIATDEGQIFKNIMDNRMKVKLIMTPKKPEPYKFPILFLNGGIIKALKGTNFWVKADKFLNSDLGLGVMNIGTQLFSNIKNSKKASDYINQDNQRIRAGKEAILSNIDIADEARNQLNLLQLLNPDIHYGEIDLLLMLLKLYQQARKKKMNEANAWEQELIDKQKELVDAIQGNGTMDFSGLISNGVSALSKYLGNPKVTSKATSKINFITTPTTFSTPTTDLGNGFSYNLNTGMTYKPTWNSMLKYLFGGKYFLPSIKTKYGYPVYWSDEVPSNYKWAKLYLKENPDVTGFAVGGEAQGPEDVGPRIIIRNSHSSYIPDHNDKRWDGLDEIEAVRHFMNETNYHPNFKISPELETFRRTNFDKNDPYNTDDDAWRQSIISRIVTNDMKGTPEQIKEADNFYEKFRKQKGRGYW